jgi:hypothetical protein
MKNGDAARYDVGKGSPVPRRPRLDNDHGEVQGPRGARPEGRLVPAARRTQVPDRAPQAGELDATDAQGEPPSLREFGPFPERLISAIRLLGLMVKAVRRKLRR